MIELLVLTTNGEKACLNVAEIVSIDGEPYSSSQPTDAGLERRIQNLEQSVVFLLGEQSLLRQPPTESSSVESPPQSTTPVPPLSPSSSDALPG